MLVSHGHSKMKEPQIVSFYYNGTKAIFKSSLSSEADKMSREYHCISDTDKEQP